MPFIIFRAFGGALVGAALLGGLSVASIGLDGGAGLLAGLLVLHLAWLTDDRARHDLRSRAHTRDLRRADCR